MKYLIRIFVVLPLSLPFWIATVISGENHTVNSNLMSKVAEWGKYD